MNSLKFGELPKGFEIRQLKIEHLDWAAAILGHTMSFDAPWIAKVQVDENPTKRAYDMYDAIKASWKLGIEAELSYGVFNLSWERRYKDTEEGGQLRWNFKDTSAPRQKLLDQMDFPLVSIAMSKDCAAAKPVLEAKEGAISWSMLARGSKTIRDTLKKRDTSGKIEPSSGTESEMGRVIKRSGTHTRGDFTRRGLATALAHHIMREFAAKGYKEILIHAGDPAVIKAWLEPPEPFIAVEGSRFNTSDAQEEFGKDVKVENMRIWVILRED
jgi:hypothetical protein